LVPAPTDALRINTTILPKGTVLHRIHASQLAGNQFNPCQGGATRFAPIEDKKGNCVPSLYAGSTVPSAIFETIFHDIPADAPFKTVPVFAITLRSHSVLQIVRDLTLAELRAPDLKKLDLRRDQLTAAPPKDYAQTAAWAAAIHAQHSGIDGLVWTSNQCDPDSAYLFFGGRVESQDFAIIAQRNGADDLNLLADIHAAGMRAGITLTL
jgi:RES domain